MNKVQRLLWKATAKGPNVCYVPAVCWVCINTSTSYFTDSYAVVTLTSAVSKGCAEHTGSQAGGVLGCSLSQLCMRQELDAPRLFW